nr:MAG TPA: holin [Siphoviridae sp. ct3an14]DAX39188.1 MAG TPA: holin [Caudoviricetes sp.]
MEQLQGLQPALVFLIVTLLGMLGKFLKESKFFPNEMIPNILGVVGGLIGTILFKDPTAITLGFSAVGLHQSYKQTVGKDTTNKTEDK